MKFITLRHNKSIAFILCLLFIAINMKALATATPGIDYRKITTENKQTVHILEVDPKLINIKLVRAKDFRHSRETVFDIAKHYHAIAAINGGFFRVNERGESCAAGLLKVKHKLYGIAYKPRAAIGWDGKNNLTLIDIIRTKTTININHYALTVHAMNTPLTSNSAILYSNSYDRKHLLFGANALHFTINDNKITHIQSRPAIKIPKNGYIYSVGSNLAKNLPLINIGDPVTIHAKLEPLLAPNTTEAWERMPSVLGGAVLLLKDGAQITDYSTEVLPSNFINTPYARTAVGTLSNGNWLLAVVEKNITDDTSGITIPELATAMRELGCINALNLDGGGSSTMYYHDNIVNQPEGDEDEAFGFAVIRKVADAIVLVPKT